MLAILQRPDEKPLEEEIIFNSEFLNDYFGAPSSAITIPFLNLMVHYVDTETKPNVSILGINFFGPILITGYRADGAPVSLELSDLAFVKRYLRAFKLKEQTTW